MRRAGKRPAGQAAIEFAIALAGSVAFIYVLLNTWRWFNQTLIERQAAFERTRLEAGKPETAGRKVPYQRPLLSLIGSPGSAGNFDDPGAIGDPPCEAAKPFYDAAQQRMQEIIAIRDEIAKWVRKVERLSRRLKHRAADVVRECNDDPDSSACDDAKTRVRRLTRRIRRIRNLHIIPLTNLVEQKQAEITQLLQQGNQACTSDQGTPGPGAEVPPFEDDTPPCSDADPFYQAGKDLETQGQAKLAEARDAILQGDVDLATALFDEANVLFDQAQDQFEQGDEACAEGADTVDPDGLPDTP